MSTTVCSYIAVLQAAMQAKGFYDGAIDGVWGPKCCDAINLWASDESFDPALPTRGQVIVYPKKLPKGLSWSTVQGKIGINYALFSEADKLKQALDKYVPVTVEAVTSAFDGKTTSPQSQATQAAPVAVPATQEKKK